MLNFNIEGLAGYLPDADFFESVSPQDDFNYSLSCKATDYVSENITKNQSRRMSELTRISVDLALKVSGGKNIDHVVFASRHGELINSTELLSMMAEGEILSPTLFSQSVHNTAVGVYSVLAKNRAAATAVAAGANSFHMGLISSYAFLQKHPQANILYISADQLIPEAFSTSLKEENRVYALAAVLNLRPLGRSVRLSQESLQSVAEPIMALQAVSFLKWFFSPQATQSTKIEGEGFVWNWKRC